MKLATWIVSMKKYPNFSILLYQGGSASADILRASLRAGDSSPGLNLDALSSQYLDMMNSKKSPRNSTKIEK